VLVRSLWEAGGDDAARLTAAWAGSEAWALGEGRGASAGLDALASVADPSPSSCASR